MHTATFHILQAVQAVIILILFVSILSECLKKTTHRSLKQEIIDPLKRLRELCGDDNCVIKVQERGLRTHEDVSCETQYGHDHMREKKRHVDASCGTLDPHEHRSGDGHYIILNGKKVRKEDLRNM